jgi:hypothetical protein
MKRTILFSLLLGLIFSLNACKKEAGNADTNYYFEATVDGVKKAYPYLPTAVMLDTLDVYSLGMLAYASAGSQELFSLNIGQESGPITTGTYVDDYTNEDRIVVGGFNPGTDDEALMYGAGLDEGPDPRLTITISEIGEKTITGTFSGTFFDHGGDGPGKVAITDGKFYMPLYK